MMLRAIDLRQTRSKPNNPPMITTATISRRTVNRTRGNRMAWSCKISPLLHRMRTKEFIAALADRARREARDSERLAHTYVSSGSDRKQARRVVRHQMREEDLHLDKFLYGSS